MTNFFLLKTYSNNRCFIYNIKKYTEKNCCSIYFTQKLLVKRQMTYNTLNVTYNFRKAKIVFSCKHTLFYNFEKSFSCICHPYVCVILWKASLACSADEIVVSILNDFKVSFCCFMLQKERTANQK